MLKHASVAVLARVCAQQVRFLCQMVLQLLMLTFASTAVPAQALAQLAQSH